jgi:outer membrane protein assembly factor BamB
VNRTTGEEVWRSEIGHYVVSGEYAGSVLAVTNTRVVGLSLTTGAVLWEIPVDVPITTRSAVVVHGDVAVLTDGETVVAALDLRSRTERWRVPVGAGNPIPGMTVTVNFIDNLVVTNSAILFSRETLWGRNHSHRPEDNESRLQQFALDQETGTPLWTSANGSVYGDSIAVGDRLFAFADTGRALVEIDARTGQERWRVKIDQPYGPDFIVVENTIYLTNYDDLYEIRW